MFSIVVDELTLSYVNSLFKPLLFLSCVENNEHRLQYFLSRNQMFNPRQLYQYSQLHYQLSVCHSSLKQHCEKYLFSRPVMPSILSNETVGRQNPKDCGSLRRDWYIKVGVVCCFLYNRVSKMLLNKSYWLFSFIEKESNAWHAM